MDEIAVTPILRHYRKAHNMLTDHFNQYIRDVKIDWEKIDSENRYPFTLNAVRSLKCLEFHPNVTFIVGENGSGKSTLLEAIAVAYGFNPEGGSRNFNFSTANTHSELHKYITVGKGISRPKDGFFLRAESFYNLASNIDELEKGGGMLGSYGGTSLHEQSHGESFMSLILNRLGGRGIYIFDEPEAALSPNRQLTLLRAIHELVNENSQFIIATHSPILMAYPNALIYNVDEAYEITDYKDTDHYRTTRDFLNNTDRMLKLLLED